MRLAHWTPRGLILLAMILMVTAGQAGASARTHDGGFFLRLSGGLGYAQSKIEEGGESVELSGATGDANFAIGGMVKPNLAIHATIIGWFTTDPEVKVCNARCETETAENFDFSMSGFGGGLTYYFMPSNLYVSGSICLASLTLTYRADNATVSRDTDYGPAIDVTVGKEWWVSDSWGIGVAGALGYHSVGDPDINANWSGISFAVRFTATYN